MMVSKWVRTTIPKIKEDEKRTRTRCYMAGDTSGAETRRVGSGRPRRRYFGGSTRGSETHRVSYGNGVDRHCRVMPPSVVLWGQTINLSVRIERTGRHRAIKHHTQTSLFESQFSSRYMTKAIVQTSQKLIGDNQICM